MESDSTTISTDATLFTGEAWFDPIEAGLRGRVRGFIEDLIEQELAAALGRGRYERRGPGMAGAADAVDPALPAGHRHGHRSRRIMGSFGAADIAVPRARMVTPEGGTAEWRSEALPRYARRTRQVEALIAGAYLAGTNTRRVPARWRRCSREPCPRTSSAAPGARCRPIGTPGAGAHWPRRTSFA